ncbi:methyltransferase domain-containing protein [Aurantimonas sp. C2-6-R+9]|uniref:class I SAM-dependent methyltransferase n=1 Tax=unclassified Aurantimonas TaxID=2638230 RepID=UPI002E17E177|nr:MULTISPECIES: methyltransferase domain-containing protein [unclassified Aurantimonas]MEC5292082.1 methyltransferase domain-containing protein [Aurantimonas sp. C2-3-R2]MEC5382236.1 methyltransferase domain-containing protein [Aurantimonas sp. C2-6-R+9]MEC5413168.1 methyltransferase domain-containing protein [Aurantimonas sp. C2-4-R8]
MAGDGDVNTPESGTGSSAADWARFLASWVRHPIKMGAVAPSSRAYCQMMVRHATTELNGPILELGPGLGVVTRALLDNGVAPERITAIEYTPNFARMLRQRFPRVNVIQGDGFDLDTTLGARRGEKFAAILFAIPIANLAQAERQALFRDYFSRLLPGGNLTQLSYLLGPPVEAVPGVFTVSASPRVWRNIPPARVWIYSQDHSGQTGAAES